MSYKITFLLNYQIKTATNKGSGCSKKMPSQDFFVCLTAQINYTKTLGFLLPRVFVSKFCN
ncbi:hypothetical protein X290_05120 [Oenococcus oeni IOEB_B16]|nr:hypothetical protein X290_05120 [Oenococcus oeni IOEB_B16]